MTRTGSHVTVTVPYGCVSDSPKLKQTESSKPQAVNRCLNGSEMPSMTLLFAELSELSSVESIKKRALASLQEALDEALGGSNENDRC